MKKTTPKNYLQLIFTANSDNRKNHWYCQTLGGWLEKIAKWRRHIEHSELVLGFFFLLPFPTIF